MPTCQETAKALANEMEAMWNAADAEGRDLTPAERSIWRSSSLLRSRSTASSRRCASSAERTEFRRGHRPEPLVRGRRTGRRVRQVGRATSRSGPVRPRPEVVARARSRLRSRIAAACADQGHAARNGRRRPGRRAGPAVLRARRRGQAVRAARLAGTCSASRRRPPARSATSSRAPQRSGAAGVAEARHEARVDASLCPRSSSRSRRSPRCSRSRTRCSRTRRASSAT